MCVPYSALTGSARQNCHPQDVDHLALVGWTGPIRFSFASWFGKPIKFKPSSFFLGMADELARRGL